MPIWLTLLTVFPAFAAPPPEVWKRIQESYIPPLKIDETHAGFSWSLCPTSDLAFTTLDPVRRTPAQVVAKVFYPRKTNAPLGRAVVLLPPTGGPNTLDIGYANNLCASGIKVVLLKEWSYQSEIRMDLATHDEGALRALAAIRHSVDYLDPKGPDQIGLLGTSVGALSASLALLVDSRLNHAVLITGGMGLAEIYSLTMQNAASKQREERMRIFGFKTPAEYRAAMEKAVTIDPKDFAENAKYKKVFAYLGLKDTVVPTKNQWDMVRILGAESIGHEDDHVETILHTFMYHHDRITAFFDRNLK